jgi:hypothetical protein
MKNQNPGLSCRPRAEPTRSEPLFKKSFAHKGNGAGWSGRRRPWLQNSKKSTWTRCSKRRLRMPGLIGRKKSHYGDRARIFFGEKSQQ